MGREISPGVRLTEHLTLVRALGHGAMGQVWIAEDSETALFGIELPTADKLAGSTDDSAVTHMLTRSALHGDSSDSITVTKPILLDKALADLARDANGPKLPPQLPDLSEEPTVCSTT